jgi:hypothetical protein
MKPFHLLVLGRTFSGIQNGVGDSHGLLRGELILVYINIL